MHLRERAAGGEEPAPPPPPLPSAPTPSTGPHPLAIAGFVVAGVGLATFAIAGGVTLSEDARLRGSCAPSCAASEPATIAVTGPVGDAGAAIALVGVALGVIGLVLPTGDERATVTAGPLGARFEVTF